MKRVLLSLGLGLCAIGPVGAAPKAVRYVDCELGWEGCCDANQWGGCIESECVTCPCEEPPANDGLTPETPMRSLRRALLTVPPGTTPEVHIGTGACTFQEGDLASPLVLPPGTILIGSGLTQGASGVNSIVQVVGGTVRLENLSVGPLVATGGSLEIDGCVFQQPLTVSDTKLDIRRSLFTWEGAYIQAWYGDPFAASNPFHMEDCTSWYGHLMITCDGVQCGPVTIERSTFIQIHAGGWFDAVNGGRMLVKLRDATWMQGIFQHGDVRFIGN